MSLQIAPRFRAPSQAAQTPSATFKDSGTQTVNAGQTFGIAEISYSVAANVLPGTYTLATTGTIDQTGSALSINTPGSIIIVPEASASRMLIFGFAAAAVLGVAGRRRFAQA